MLTFKSHAKRRGRQESDRKYWHERKGRAHEVLRHSVRYKKWRKYMLARWVLCADPMGYHREDCVVVASCELHHMRGLALHPEDLCDSDKVQAVCRSCHAVLEKQLRGSCK